MFYIKQYFWCYSRVEFLSYPKNEFCKISFIFLPPTHLISHFWWDLGSFAPPPSSLWCHRYSHFYVCNNAVVLGNLTFLLFSRSTILATPPWAIYPWTLPLALAMIGGCQWYFPHFPCHWCWHIYPSYLPLAP